MAKRKDKPNKTSNDSNSSCQSGGQYWAESVLDWSLDPTGQLTYLVKWYGYGPEENTWEVGDNIGQCEGLLLHFYTSTVNGRHPPKWSFDELDKFRDYLRQLCETPDLAVYRKIYNSDIDCFQIRHIRTIKEIQQFVGQHLADLLNGLKSVKSKTNSERLEIIKVVKQILRSLNIKKAFGSITQFLEFVDRRRVVNRELITWEKEVNHLILTGNEGKPIKVVNDVDLDKPKISGYITDYIMDNRFDLGLEDEKPLLGCKCDDCHELRDHCCTAVHGFPMVYNEKGRLSFKRYNTVVYECNSQCQCSSQCVNRQIQRGRQFELEIFRTDSEIRGWGVRALQNIPKGSFITKYTGEVISLVEAARRPTTYLFDLSAHLETSENEYTYVVDAFHYGNVTRFVNHSCDPNCRILFAWVERSANRLLPIIALFAVKDIVINEELTYDYSMESNRSNKNYFPVAEILTHFNDYEDNDSMETKPKKKRVAFERIECECQAINCRKILYS